MVVAVDIGNSNVVIGIFQEDRWSHFWRIPTKVDPDSSLFYELELQNLLLEHQVSHDTVSGVILSTVVPDLRDIFRQLLSSTFFCQVEVVGPDMYDKLNFAVPRPYEIGTDLVANAYAAFKEVKKDCIVVDFGTALTFTTVSKEGFVKGVAIAPGIKTAMKALASNTAQLPEIPLELPVSVLGQNTTHALQAGILWGYVGMTKELLAKIREEEGEELLAIATGGLSFVMEPLEDVFYTINPSLTINGLRYMLQDIKSK